MSDSEYIPDGILIDLVTQDWRQDQLPNEDIVVQPGHLPELDPDSSDQQAAEKQEGNWPDRNLHNLIVEHS